MQRKQSSCIRLGLAAMLALLMTSLAPKAAAQVERNIPTEPYAVDESYLSGLNWRNIGPNRGERSIAAAGSNPTLLVLDDCIDAVRIDRRDGGIKCLSWTF